MSRETQPALWAILFFAASSCTASDEGGAQGGGDANGGGPTHSVVTVELDDGSAGEGIVLLYEVEVGAGAMCVASVVLASEDQLGAVFPSTLAFLDRSPGTGSIGIPGTDYNSVYWKPGDPRAPFGEVTDSWSGAFALSEWSLERIAITLQDGEHCPVFDGSTATECVAASGELLIEGPRFPDTADPFRERFTDLATGQVLCDFDW